MSEVYVTLLKTTFGILYPISMFNVDISGVGVGVSVGPGVGVGVSVGAGVGVSVGIGVSVEVAVGSGVGVGVSVGAGVGVSVGGTSVAVGLGVGVAVGNGVVVGVGVGVGVDSPYEVQYPLSFNQVLAVFASVKGDKPLVIGKIFIKSKKDWSVKSVDLQKPRYASTSTCVG